MKITKSRLKEIINEELKKAKQTNEVFDYENSPQQELDIWLGRLLAGAPEFRKEDLFGMLEDAGWQPPGGEIASSAGTRKMEHRPLESWMENLDEQ